MFVCFTPPEYLTPMNRTLSSYVPRVARIMVVFHCITVCRSMYIPVIHQSFFVYIYISAVHDISHLHNYWIIIIYFVTYSTSAIIYVCLDCCCVQVIGSPEVVYVSHETPMVMYLNSHVAIDQLRRSSAGGGGGGGGGGGDTGAKVGHFILVRR